MKRPLVLAMCLLLLSGSAAVAQVAAPGTQPLPPTIRIEPVGSLKLDAGPGPSFWSSAIPIVGPLLSAAIALFGVLLVARNAEANTRRTIEAAQANSDAALWQKANETELRDIQAKLDGFYIPFQLLSEANFQFASDLRSRQGGEYRLLLKLFDKEWREQLSVGNKKLVEIVCTNADALRKLILSKSGLVDDKLLPYLSRTSAHFRMLHLAFKNELGDEPERFKEYVYPRQLDGAIELEIARLRRRMEQLRANPGSRPPPLEALVIPPGLELPEWNTEGPSVDSTTSRGSE